MFEPKIKDPLDDVIEIINLPDVEHKKTMFPYVEPTVETADEIDTKQEIIDTDFIDLQNEFNKVNDVATGQKKQKKIENTIESIIDDENPFSTFDDFWWEDDMFSNRDSIATVNASRNILDEINDISDNILKSLQPVDNRTEQELADNQNIPLDDRTQQELEDDDYISLESDVDEIDTTLVWDQNRTTITKLGPIIQLSKDFNRKVKVATKIKNKYKKKPLDKEIKRSPLTG